MSSQDSTIAPITIDIQYRTIQDECVPVTDARKLHAQLGILTQFTDWMPRRIEEYGFVEGIDYLFFSNLRKTTGRPEHGYLLTLDMAKELCMVERTSKGREARQYFIRCEKLLSRGASGQRLGEIEERLERLESLLTQPLEGAATQGTLTKANPPLPPPVAPIRERAEISTHLIAVWRVLLQADEPLTNRDIARLADIGERTVRSHTRYLTQLGVVDVYEAFPRHLYRIAAQAEKRNTGYYRRLEEFRAIYDAQAQRFYR